MSAVIIRRATRHDLAWILDELRTFDAFFGAARSLIPTDPAKAEALLLQLMDPDVGCFFLAERTEQHGDELEVTRLGFVVGLLGRHPYNAEIRMLTELFWWVTPAYRRSRAALALLEAYVAFGRALADWIVFTLEHDSPVNPETLTRRGFVPKSSDYLLEV